MKILGTTDSNTITVHVPMVFTIRGGRKTIISEAVQARRSRESTMPCLRPWPAPIAGDA